MSFFTNLLSYLTLLKSGVQEHFHFTLFSSPERPKDLLYQHEYIAPEPTDSRCPCPALNALANHGYLPRDGRSIPRAQLFESLQLVYGVSSLLAAFLIGGSSFVEGQVHPSLHDLARHTCDPLWGIEHDASILRRDTPQKDEYGHVPVDEVLYREFVAGAEERPGGLDMDYLAQVRVNREAYSRRHHSEGWEMNKKQNIISRGECALILSIFGDIDPAPPKSILSRIWDFFNGPSDASRARIPLDIVKTWWHDERLPEGWTPKKEPTTLWNVNKCAKELGKLMTQKKSESREGPAPVVVRQESFHDEESAEEDQADDGNNDDAWRPRGRIPRHQLSLSSATSSGSESFSFPSTPSNSRSPSPREISASRKPMMFLDAPLTSMCPQAVDDILT